MPTMFVLARSSEYARVRKTYISLPLVTALATPDLDERRKLLRATRRAAAAKGRAGTTRTTRASAAAIRWRR